MSNTAATEKKWLVKSSGKILGPFSFEEVASDLQERKVSLIDEIRSPNERWLFIRESRHFQEVVQKLREQDQAKEDTSTTFVGTRSITQDLTPPPVSTQASAASSMTAPSNSNSALASMAKTPEVLEASPVLMEKPTPQPVYVSNRDVRIQKRVEPQRRKAALWGWLLLFFVIGGVAALQWMPRRELSRALGYEDLLKLARSSKAIGQNEKALELYRKAEAMKPLDASNELQLVPLLMMVENQNVQARQIVESLMSKGLEPNAKKDAESLIALSFLREARLDEAQKRYRDLIQKYPDNEAARINLVEISLLQGQFDLAAEKINELIKAGFKEQILFLYRILTIYRTTDDAAKLEGAKSDLRRLLAQYQDYRSEMLLLLAAIQKKLNQDLDVGDSLKNLLDTDPDLTRKHIHDWRVDHEVLDWGYLGNICEILVKEGGVSPIFKGLTVYCTYEQGDLKTALDQMEKARSQFANDTSLIGLHAFLLSKSGRTNEARALLQMPKSTDANLAGSVKASMCENLKDWSCAEDNWKRVLQKDSRHIGAFAGLARVALERGHPELAQDYLKQGLLISNGYQPFLELNDRIYEH